jgi:hypothetical protein
MNSRVHSTVSTRLVKKAGTSLVLALAAFAMTAPADARKGGSSGASATQFRAATTSLTPLPPVVRDHRGGAIIRDARTGTVTRDHRGGAPITSMPGTKKRGVQCLGSMCNVKICTAGFCF